MSLKQGTFLGIEEDKAAIETGGAKFSYSYTPSVGKVITKMTSPQEVEYDTKDSQINYIAKIVQKNKPANPAPNVTDIKKEEKPLGVPMPKSQTTTYSSRDKRIGLYSNLNTAEEIVLKVLELSPSLLDIKTEKMTLQELDDQVLEEVYRVASKIGKWCDEKDGSTN